jgi:transposase-like protein
MEENVPSFCSVSGLKGNWNYLKDALAELHGVFKEKFPLYLKEIDF